MHLLLVVQQFRCLRDVGYFSRGHDHGIQQLAVPVRADL
jgi:hypothetical protein